MKLSFALSLAFASLALSAPQQTETQTPPRAVTASRTVTPPGQHTSIRLAVAPQAGEEEK
ncbi:hypothetical protein BM1_09546 [Bipolaris maydis]|nr:hypothetical protein BM1_09546 [Bipolaris maydis]